MKIHKFVNIYWDESEKLSIVGTEKIDSWYRVLLSIAEN